MHRRSATSSVLLALALVGCSVGPECEPGTRVDTTGGQIYVWHCGARTLRTACVDTECTCEVTAPGRDTLTLTTAPVDELRLGLDPTAARTLALVDGTCGWNLCGNTSHAETCPELGRGVSIDASTPPSDGGRDVGTD